MKRKLPRRDPEAAHAANRAVGNPEGAALLECTATGPTLRFGATTRFAIAGADLGAVLEVSRQTINAIETGRYLPSLPLALSLARFFSTSVEQMFQLYDEEGE